MKYRLARDRQLRLRFLLNEIYIVALKFFIYCYFLRTNPLFFFNLINFNFFHEFLSNYSKMKMTNYCTQSGRARGVINFFSLSRLSFRELAVKGLISGVRRAI